MISLGFEVVCGVVCGVLWCLVPHMVSTLNQSRTNGPINDHLTIAQVMPRYNHNNEKQEALL